MTVFIDGSLGEGGGQVLRTALSLAALTGRELRIADIRANRSKPGLRPQHLQAVQATAEICDARVEGDRLGSTEIRFKPREVKAGPFQFSIPTAGSASLVLQTIFYPLALADGTSQVTIRGGTHVKWSPCFHYLDWQWLAYLKKMGYRATLNLKKTGYYPKGGGEIQATIYPSPGNEPLHVVKRGDLSHIRGLCGVTNLPDHITRRMRQGVVSRLGKQFPLQDIRTRQLPGHDKGAFIVLLVSFAASQACYSSLGEVGKRAEVVADEAIDQVTELLRRGGSVDQFLGDQLLLPLSLLEEGSQIHVTEITSHLVTNAEIIKHFLPVEFEIDGQIGQSGLVSVHP